MLCDMSMTWGVKLLQVGGRKKSPRQARAFWFQRGVTHFSTMRGNDNRRL